MELKIEELKDFLDEKVAQYDTISFIDTDPISIPHRYSKKEDIEISGFLTATIAWGNRKMILKNANRMMEILDDTPYDFVMNHTEGDLNRIKGVIHRTFNHIDLLYFIKVLKHIYLEEGGLEGIFNRYQTTDSLQPAIHELNRIFFCLQHEKRTERHVSDPYKGSAAKRINMFLRWMVRSDGKGVDFGIWKKIPSSILSIPLDVHSGNVSRKLGLLTRKQSDAKAVEELDSKLRLFDKDDPVKYDYALFGLGVFENF
ncbi:MAG: TIGR02757 family protein [Bacteroidales bacterium]|nr:TIGR02757 family protein [Bacteroidales bacterium]